MIFIILVFIFFAIIMVIAGLLSTASGRGQKRSVRNNSFIDSNNDNSYLSINAMNNVSNNVSSGCDCDSACDSDTGCDSGSCDSGCDCSCGD